MSEVVSTPTHGLLRSNSAPITPKAGRKEDAYLKRIRELESFILSLNLDTDQIASLNIKPISRLNDDLKENESGNDSATDVIKTPLPAKKVEKKLIHVKSNKKIMFRSPENLKKIIEHHTSAHKRKDSNGSIASGTVTPGKADVDTTPAPRRVARAIGRKATPFKSKKAAFSETSDTDAAGCSADEGNNITTPIAATVVSESETPKETLKERRAKQRAAALTPKSSSLNTSVSITIPESMSRRAATIAVDAAVDGGDDLNGITNATETTKKAIPSRLAARLGGTVKRTPTAATTAKTTDKDKEVTSSLTDKTKAPVKKPVSSSRPTSTKKQVTPKVVSIFQWRVAPPEVTEENKEAVINGNSAEKVGTSSVRVFVVHDNPQISNTVNGRLKTPAVVSEDGTVATSSSGGMQLMLESKGKNDQIHFMIGDIIYSGAYANIQDANIPNCRGSECLILTNLRAVRHPIKQFVQRTSPTNKDIVEINMVDLPASSIVDVSTTEAVSEFFANCKARVECILDPSHVDNTWYPYFEGGEGPQRKMAPQFRSQGIGYIRLGDEFSNYGIAFISLDAGSTYLDNGATSIDNKSPYGAPSSKFYATPVKPKKLVRKNSNSDGEELTGLDLPGTAVKGSAKKTSATNARKNSDVQQLMEFLLDTVHSLKDPTMKFTQRTDVLKKLRGQLTSLLVEGYNNNIEAFIEKHKDLIADIISVLLDHLKKQKNPLVMTNVVNCVGCLSYGEQLTINFSSTWRSVLVETIHLLRSSNKQVYEASLIVLNALYKAKSITYSDLVMNMTDILSGVTPGSATASSSASSTVTGGATLSSTQSFGVNVAKVISWLESVAKVDLDLCIKFHVSAEGAAALASTTPGPEGSHHNTMSSVYQMGLPSVMKKLIPLLSNREEVVRDSTASLMITYFTMMILYSYSHLNAFMQLMKAHTEEDCLTSPALFFTNVVVDEAGLDVLNSIEKSGARSYDKIVAGAIQYTCRLMRTVNNDDTSSALKNPKRVSIASRLSSSSEASGCAVGGGKQSLGSVEENSTFVSDDVDEV